MTPEELEILEALEGACVHVDYFGTTQKPQTMAALHHGGFIEYIEGNIHLMLTLTRAGREVLALRRKLKESESCT